MNELIVLLGICWLDIVHMKLLYTVQITSTYTTPAKHKKATKHTDPDGAVPGLNQ